MSERCHGLADCICQPSRIIADHTLVVNRQTEHGALLCQISRIGIDNVAKQQFRSH